MRRLQSVLFHVGQKSDETQCARTVQDDGDDDADAGRCNQRWVPHVQGALCGGLQVKSGVILGGAHFCLPSRRAQRGAVAFRRAHFVLFSLVLVQKCNLLFPINTLFVSVTQEMSGSLEKYLYIATSAVGIASDIP